MAIREFWGIEGLPPYTVGTAIVNYIRGDMLLKDNVVGQIIKLTSGGLQWLQGASGNNGTWYNPAFGVPYQNISDFTTRRSYFGFRHQINGTNPATAVVRLINTAGTIQNVVLNTQLALSLNQYIEVMFDRVNKLIVVWIDNVQVSSTFFDFNAFVAADGNASLYFGAATFSGVQFVWQMRDFYFLDDTQDATQCNRLGPVDVRQSMPASISASNWISSDAGTPLADLTTPLGTTAATQTLPTQTEPASMDPMVIGFGTGNVVTGEKIVAFKADVSAQRSAGYVFSPATTVKLGAATANGKTLTYPVGNAMYYNQNAFLKETAPDGSAWTPNSIQSAVVTLTP
jgi:hypothetical protein